MIDYLGRPYHVGDELVVSASESSYLYKCTVETISEETLTNWRGEYTNTYINVKLASNGRRMRLRSPQRAVIIGGPTFAVQPVQESNDE